MVIYKSRVCFSKERFISKFSTLNINNYIVSDLMSEISENGDNDDDSASDTLNRRTCPLSRYECRDVQVRLTS
jgi:hypothetical protein